MHNGRRVGAIPGGEITASAISNLRWPKIALDPRVEEEKGAACKAWKTSRLLNHERKKKEAESTGGGPLGLKAKYVEILSFLNIDFLSPRVVST